VIFNLFVKYATRGDNSHIKKKKKSERNEEYCILSTSYQSILFALLPMPTRWEDVIIETNIHKQKKEEKEKNES
jgi:hypothetical protein